MRDNFSNKVKAVVAQRVAYRCSFPGCNRLTIGPGNRNNEHVILLGEAAHIYSASPQGPRSNPNITSKQRTSIDNAIWMCKSHSRIIDVNESEFSAETLLKWKIDAENFVYQKLEALEKEEIIVPYTLIMLRDNIVFKGKWLSAIDNTWTFRLQSFLIGNISDLKEFISNFSDLDSTEKYVLIESEGDGRLLNNISWSLDDDNNHIIHCKMSNKPPRKNPNHLGSDLAIADDGDLILKDGDLGMVHGIDTALQAIRIALSTEKGWWANPEFGSNFTKILSAYYSDQNLLNSITKLELIKLLLVPLKDNLLKQSSPSLDFINRVLSVNVILEKRTSEYLPILLSLEWGNGEYWEGEIRVPC